MAPLSVESLGGGWYVVNDGTRRWRVAVAGRGGEHWVFVDGLVSRVTAPELGSARGRSKSAGDAAITAPMPATVAAIHTSAGQSVKQGETVIVLEAMKMELPIRSPRDGVVKAVLCTTGELVQPGVNLLELE